MKKRQKPILLVTLLVMFVAAAVGMNYMTDPSRKQQEQEPDPSTQVDAPRQIDHSNVGATAATQLAGKPMPKGSPMGAPGGAGILKPQMNSTPMKPRPDENSISSQWYSKEHH